MVPSRAAPASPWLRGALPDELAPDSRRRRTALPSRNLAHALALTECPSRDRHREDHSALPVRHVASRHRRIRHLPPPLSPVNAHGCHYVPGAGRFSTGYHIHDGKLRKRNGSDVKGGARGECCAGATEPATPPVLAAEGCDQVATNNEESVPPMSSSVRG